VQRGERTVLNKLHLKRNAMDRFALCGILLEQSFVLMATLSRKSASGRKRAHADSVLLRLWIGPHTKNATGGDRHGNHRGEF
jgi:hypothetical protein